MFKNKKMLKQIQEEKEQIEEKRKLLEKEKKELLFIKEQLEDITPKIDTSNIYVWEFLNVYYIVRMDVKNIIGKNIIGKDEEGYQSELIDIFTNNIVYQKCSKSKITRTEFISGGENAFADPIYGYLYSLEEIDKNILMYTDRKVPLYVLQQLYYKLNKVDVSAYTLKKTKN